MLVKLNALFGLVGTSENFVARGDGGPTIPGWERGFVCWTGTLVCYHGAVGNMKGGCLMDSPFRCWRCLSGMAARKSPTTHFERTRVCRLHCEASPTWLNR